MSLKKTTKLSKLILFSIIGLFIGGFAALKSQDKSSVEYSALLDYDKAHADVPSGSGGTSDSSGTGTGTGSGDTGQGGV